MSNPHRIRSRKPRILTFAAADELDAPRLNVARLGAHLTMLRAELEREPLVDADPCRSDRAVRRFAIVEHVLDVAQAGANCVRAALGSLVAHLPEVERLQIEAGGVEAMLVLLGRELDRAPWDATDERRRLIRELVAAAQDAARLVRTGLGAAAQQLSGAV